MIVQPKVKSFMCTTAHPVGCRTAVKQQIDYIGGVKGDVDLNAFIGTREEWEEWLNSFNQAPNNRNN